MRKTRYSEEQIVGILKEAAAKVADLIRKHGISEQSFYRWSSPVLARSTVVTASDAGLSTRRKRRQPCPSSTGSGACSIDTCADPAASNLPVPTTSNGCAGVVKVRSLATTTAKQPPARLGSWTT